MRSDLTKILLLCCIASLMLGLAYWVGHRQGQQKGTSTIQEKWDADRAANKVAQDALLEQIAEQEKTHRKQQEKVTHELVQAREGHAADLAALRGVYEQRLLQSTRRGETYRRQAEAGAASCRSLAGHAAQLDRALEEGRGLVLELREALGLRDRQLILLGEQIHADRRLMEPR